MNTLPPESVMREAIRTRDADYDGIFFFAVRSTGIFCRPSCKSKPAKPDNLRFFATPAHASAAGFRPCKRCQPTQLEQRPPWVDELANSVTQEPWRRITAEELQRCGLTRDRLRKH